MNRIVFVSASVFCLLNLVAWPVNKYEWMLQDDPKMILPIYGNSVFYSVLAIVPDRIRIESEAQGLLDSRREGCQAGGMRVFSVCLVTTLAGCGAGLNDNGGSGATGEEDPGVAGIVAAHNAARAAVQPAPAAPLAPLTWSAAAFEQARAWAARCQWGHNPTRGSFGENLFATSGDTTSQAVVDTWVSEKSDYDYAANSCSGTCGHYTQVVWSATTGVGCAAQTCTSGSPFGGGSWQFWVCDYTPPGNSGGRPY